MSINVTIDMDYELALSRSVATFTMLQRDLLIALANGDEVAAGQLAPLLGLKHHARLNLTIAGIARKLSRAADVEPPKRASGSNRWWQIVATGREVDGRFFWKIRPALQQAVVALGLLPEPRRLFPEVVAETTEQLMEGEASTALVNAYERNPVARRRCIEHYGASCSVCSFNFEAFYGQVAAGVIHVHHLKPLAAGPGTSHVVDPIEDLRPVCANCHIVIHRRDPPFSMDEARALIAGAGAQSDNG